MDKTVLPAGAGPVDGTVRPVAEAIERAMRNFAIDCAYGDQAQRKASADALRAAVRAEVSAERERCAKACEAEAENWRGDQDIRDFMLCAARIRSGA